LVENFQNKKVWIDATLVLRAGVENATGIPRVEAGLCSFALRNPHVGLVFFDKKIQRYSVVSNKSEKYLKFLIENRMQNAKISYAENLIKNLKHLSFKVYNNRSRSTKHIALAISGDNFLSKYIYPFSYIIVFIALLIVKVFSRDNNKQWIPVSDKPSIMITSFNVKQFPNLSIALQEFGAIEAHIFYDILPILHPSFFNEKLRDAVNSWMSRALLTDAPIITISETVAGEVNAWNERDIKAVRSVPIKACKLTVPFDVHSTDVQMVPTLQEKRFAMFVSQIDVRKGQDHLIRVWKQLHKKVELSLLPDLVLIGRKGNGWKGLERELEDLGPLRDKIHIFTNMGDGQLRWCFQNASFSLFPSIAEGWGLGISESLAYGVPVLHSDIPIFHEVSQGLMPSAAPRDIDGWVSKITSFLEQPEKLDALRDKIKDNYVTGHPDDFARCTIAYLEVFHAGLNKKLDTASFSVNPTLN
jgi:glycosyltransferase involved in cell wall biosynthesis